jgi:hypothetical protein
MTNNINSDFPDENCSGLYNIKGYSILTKVLDVQNDFVLFKDLITGKYTVAVLTENKTIHMTNPPNVSWITHEQADEVMRNVLKTDRYSKATDDFFK